VGNNREKARTNFVKADTTPVTTLIAPEVLNEPKEDDIDDANDKEDDDQGAGKMLSAVNCENLPNYNRFTHDLL
jgi:hypothetical protein